MRNVAAAVRCVGESWNAVIGAGMLSSSIFVAGDGACSSTSVACWYSVHIDLEASIFNDRGVTRRMGKRNERCLV